jgi:glycosyltransferase involved in cell wall biosynthesis
VTDNEGSEQIKELCHDFGRGCFDSLLYVHEPRRGISHARNTCLDNIPDGTDFVAMIDDDEVPAQDWLEQLLVAQRESGADVVIGPTTPTFESQTPAWVALSGFFKKPRDQDSLVHLQADPAAATCNALVRSRPLATSGVRFHPRLALSGGEDALFFRELRHAGCTFAWSAHARVFETIPPQKARLAYMLREEFRRGNVRIFLNRFMEGRVRGPAGPVKTARVREGRRAVKRILCGLGGVLGSLPRWSTRRDRMAMSAARIARGVGMLSGLLGIRNRHYQ